MNNEILAIIPARGGSKSIPRKNIKELAGKPLIAYSIEQAKASKRITRTIVSTDDEEIAEVARKWGAEVPFLRPAEISGDHATDVECFEHALVWLREHENYEPGMIMHLRPTSPLRTVQMIDDALDLLSAHPDADSVRGIAIPHDNPHKMWRVGEDGFMQPLLTLPDIAEPWNSPRQILPKVWYQIAYVDAIWPKTILEQKSMTGKKIFPLYLNVDEYIDLDSMFDWHVLETYIEKLK